MKLAVHYFSATGNTARAVDIIRRAFTERGWEVSLHAILSVTQPPRAEVDLILIAFPTIAFDVPVFVARYLRRLPRSRGGKAAVFSTFGGDPYGSLGHAAAIFGRLGYEVVSTGGALYPDNWTQMVNPPPPEEAEERRSIGDRDAAAFALKLLAGKREIHPSRATMMSFLISLLFRVFGRRFLGMAYAADARCTGCGLCARTCPVHAISMAGGKVQRPRWGFTCADCGRCINICPAAAIQTSIPKLILHFAANAAIIYGLVMAAGPVDRAAADFAAAPWRYGIDIVALAALAALGLWIEAVPFERFLDWLGRSRVLGAFFAWSLTARFRRYRVPGFRVPEREKPEIS